MAEAIRAWLMPSIGVLSKITSKLKNFQNSKKLFLLGKHRQSGKHAILRGETRIATPIILEKIEKSEAATEARKQRKEKAPPPPTPTSQIAHPPPNNDSSDSNSDDGILDRVNAAIA
jgi:hypothetical protein